jgi:ribonuclease-3
MIKKTKRSPDWFEQASIHSSTHKPTDNERLEFLGDSVLSLVLSEYLFRTHPEIDEGVLSKWRSSLVNESSLQKIGKLLKLDKKLKTAQSPITDRMIASAFEAYIGAYFLTYGWPKVRQKTLTIFKKNALEQLSSYMPDDYKTQLQEVVQAKHKTIPTYNLVLEQGPSHSRVFKSEVKVAGKVLGIGEGKSKKASEQLAAKNALDKLSKSKELSNEGDHE